MLWQKSNFSSRFKFEPITQLTTYNLLWNRGFKFNETVRNIVNNFFFCHFQGYSLLYSCKYKTSSFQFKYCVNVVLTQRQGLWNGIVMNLWLCAWYRFLIVRVFFKCSWSKIQNCSPSPETLYTHHVLNSSIFLFLFSYKTQKAKI